MTTRNMTTRQAMCGAHARTAKATTTLRFSFGAGTFENQLCKDCGFQMQGDLYRWSRAGSRGAARPARLGNCGACNIKRKATTWQTLGLPRGTYGLALCDSCADKMYDDLTKWSRVGTLVEETDSATLKPHPSAPRRRGKIARAFKLEIPVHHVEDVEVDEAPDEAPAPLKERAVRPEVLPANYRRWGWASHALERFVEREAEAEILGLTPMTIEDVLWTAENPDYVRPSSDPQWPDSKVHVRGYMQVVVNPATAVIITVIDRRVRVGEAQRVS